MSPGISKWKTFPEVEVVDSFVETITRYVIDAVAPREAAAKIRVGDQEAADLISEMTDPKSTYAEAAANRTVLQALERVQENVTLYGSKTRKLPGQDFPVSLSNAAGVFFPTLQSIYIDTVRRNREQQQNTMRHEAGHALYAFGLQEPNWLDRFLKVKRKLSSIQFYDINDEQIADILGHASTTAPAAPSKESLEKVRFLLKSLYGTIAPFDREPQ
jgi:hypothetical protein